jgi:hypothetical protein
VDLIEDGILGLMAKSDHILEVKDLGKGMGPPGAKMSKAMGMPGVSVSNKNKLVKEPGATSPKKTPVAKEPKGMTPDAEGEAPQEAPDGAEGEMVDTAPEVVEKLPDPEKMEFDKLGAPDKHSLVGHIVRWGSKEYILDWDDEFEVYKIVDPETLRVKTRIRPDSISTVDFKAESLQSSIRTALCESHKGVPVDQIIDGLLDG